MAAVEPRRRKQEVPEEQPALFYLMRRLERAEDQHLARTFSSYHRTHHEVDTHLLELFIRRIRQQNIFVRIMGPNGKRESLLLSKVLFSMSKVIRLYCSLSVRDEDNVYLRIFPDTRTGLIRVQRLRGGDVLMPEEVFAHADQCHIIRFITRWIVERVDWQKTKLRNLDIYKLFVQTRQEQLEQKLASLNEYAQMQRVIKGGNRRGGRAEDQA
ncbi:hypothetical protein [Sulfurivirga sp.]|uniref:hypothetical protein n=1 Tax=Sulfurivirga sp. TaxID=2614236 RepID=UPI0025FBE15D|nr:hypothetical protein [Sulfurivirga sp.]